MSSASSNLGNPSGKLSPCITDQALSEAQRGIALDPNSGDAYFWLADTLNSQAKPAEALEAVETAMRLDPLNGDTYLYEQGWAYSLLGRRKEAIPALKRDLVRYPDMFMAPSLLGRGWAKIAKYADGPGAPSPSDRR